MQGSLSAGSFAAALRDLHLGRETGLLHCAQPGALRSLRFQRGDVIHVLSDQKDERLGETLLRLGVISGEQLVQATAVLVAERKRLGPVLIELGVLSFGQLQEALGRHIRDVFERVLSKLEGQLVFEAVHEDNARPDETRPLLQTGDLVLEATRRMAPAEVTAALGDLARPLALGSGAGMLAAALKLSPSEGFLLSRIDGSTARDALSLLPGDAAEAERSLLGLIACGIAAWGTARRAPAARADDRPRVTRMPVIEGRTPDPVVPAAGSSPTPAAGFPAVPKPGPAAPAPAAAPAGPDPETAKREKQAELRKAIEEAHAALGNETHFEVLGLTRSATEAELKEAYFRLAKRFHPDSCNDEALHDLKPKAEQLFIRIGKAWDVMRNPKARADYEANLPRARPVPQASNTAEPAGPPTPRTQALAAEVEVARANDNVRKAEKLAQEEKYWDAIQLFEAALPIASGNYPLRAHLGLARCYLKNPNWARRGEEQLHKAAQDFPKSIEPPFELARLYRDRGMKARAIGQLRKVLDLKPEYEEAAGLLAELDGGPRTDPAPPAGGLLGKLLGRK
ncbi:MAG: DnaJ domain-containing protein [Vicinamibacteria bacterium]|nr:DnaJ domain-containing protein [Vicinamibacteria bacterium]